MSFFPTLNSLVERPLLYEESDGFSPIAYEVVTSKPVNVVRVSTT